MNANFCQHLAVRELARGVEREREEPSGERDEGMEGLQKRRRAEWSKSKHADVKKWPITCPAYTLS